MHFPFKRLLSGWSYSFFVSAFSPFSPWRGKPGHVSPKRPLPSKSQRFRVGQEAEKDIYVFKIIFLIPSIFPYYKYNYAFLWVSFLTIFTTKKSSTTPVSSSNKVFENHGRLSKQWLAPLQFNLGPTLPKIFNTLMISIEEGEENFQFMQNCPQSLTSGLSLGTQLVRLSTRLLVETARGDHKAITSLAARSSIYCTNRSTTLCTANVNQSNVSLIYLIFCASFEFNQGPLFKISIKKKIFFHSTSRKCYVGLKSVLNASF